VTAMKRTARTTLPAVMLLVSACVEGPRNKTPPGEGALAGLAAALSKQALTLRTMMMADTVPRQGQAGLMTLVVNGGDSRVFTNNPDLFSYAVQTQGGGKVAPWSHGAVTRSFGDQTQVTMPARSVFGQVIDLRCIRPGYRPSEGSCDYGYTLNEPGRYRVITSYHWGDSARSTAVSLVDTAAFVVR